MRANIAGMIYCNQPVNWSFNFRFFNLLVMIDTRFDYYTFYKYIAAEKRIK